MGQQFEDAIDQLASPALAFTERAKRCARRNNYRHPDAMFTSIEKLEKLARLYHDGDLDGRLVEAAQKRFGLRVALQDSSYTSTRFEFEGAALDRLPHVKIDDYTAPSEVGRVYFALDSDQHRFVVDWFGVKQDRP